MSTAPTEVRRKAPRAKNKGAQSAKTIERSTLRAMWEATVTRSAARLATGLRVCALTGRDSHPLDE